MGVIQLKADLVHSPRCNVCRKLRDEDTNNWWELSIIDGGCLVVGTFRPPVQEDRAYLCGKDHLVKLLSEKMDEIVEVRHAPHDPEQCRKVMVSKK